MLNGKTYRYYGFDGCDKLETVVLPSTITSLSNYVFRNCTSLTSVNIEDTSIGYISNSMFYSCTSLKSINLSDKITSIQSLAFTKCQSLESLVIPESVREIAPDAFGGTDKMILHIKSPYIYDYSFTHNIPISNPIFALTSMYSRISNVWDGDIFDEGRPDCYPIEITKSLSDITFGMHTPDGISITSITCNGQSLIPDNDNHYTINGHTGRSIVEVTYSDSEAKHTYSLITTIPTISLSYETKQTSITAKLKFTTDLSYTPTVAGVNVEGIGRFDIQSPNYTVEITGLTPNTKYAITPFAVYNSLTFYGSTYQVTTQNMGLKVNVTNLGPTSVTLSGSYRNGGATVTSYGFTTEKNDKIVFDDLSQATFDLLDPETEYTFFFGVDTEYFGRWWNFNTQFSSGGVTTTYGTTVKTSALTWKTPESTATSTTSARMSVETNCDAESGAGFEWRRIDAPDLVPSSKAPCAVIDGKLMGSLRNLNPEVYYKFRPYYTSASGKSYYGEWTGLFTGDANVYFEPEVRTVAGAVATERSIKLAGYALAGSDDITEQGFEYRAVGKTDPRSRAAATWIRIPATGIKMETVIDDLDYATTYRYRAYAVTAKGTFYGDEQEFATEGESAIDDIIADTTDGLTVTLRENPATGTAWLRVSTTTAGELRYIITSVSGAAVSTGTIPAADDTWQPVELTIPSGLYLLTVTDGTSAKTLRLIVR